MSTPLAVPPALWMSRVLVAAGIYNMVWGAWTILAPGASLRLGGLPDDPVVQPIWQCLGMVIGVYGIGYWLSARDPFRHWIIILVGLLGKVLGPIGYVYSVYRGVLPPDGFKTLLTNDLIWWVPFTVILWRAALWHDASSAVTATGTALRTLIGSTGRTLADLSAGQRVLVVFLRHSGCTFCREALADLAKARTTIEQSGTRIALIFMSSDDDMRPLVEKYGIADLPRYSDPQRQLYQEFDLLPGGPSQLMGPKVWWRGFLTAISAGHGFGGIKESVFQMPGSFLVEDGRIKRAYRHQTAADRPDYAELACPLPGPGDR